MFVFASILVKVILECKTSVLKNHGVGMPEATWAVFTKPPIFLRSLYSRKVKNLLWYDDI